MEPELLKELLDLMYLRDTCADVDKGHQQSKIEELIAKVLSQKQDLTRHTLMCALKRRYRDYYYFRTKNENQGIPISYIEQPTFKFDKKE